MPRISILLPNLNNRRYLTERLATIKAQTVTDWELVVSDNYSDDGAWEFLREEAARDSRILAEQAPREGLYQNWNRCIARARGDYVYIATSDDTMTPDCLAKLAAALDAHPEADIAQCCLHAIDEEGRVIADWWKLVGAARFLRELYEQPHVRRAPVDGILHSGMVTMYHSITQILVRRDVFSRAGVFPTEWGSAGDFVWGMRAGFLCTVVHVPEFLATWRIHATQASSNFRPDSAHFWKMTRMVAAAFDESVPRLPSDVRLPSRDELLFPFRFFRWHAAWAEEKGPFRKLRLAVRIAFDDWPTFVRLMRMRRSQETRRFDVRAYLLELLQRYGYSHHIARC